LILMPVYNGQIFQTSLVSCRPLEKGVCLMNTFEKLRMIDRIAGKSASGEKLLSAGAAALLSLIQRVQRERKFYISTADAFAAALKVSRRSVMRYLRELQDLGLVAVWKRFAVRDGVRRNIASGYRVLIEAVRDAATVGFRRRGAAIKAKAVAAVSRCASVLRKPLRCDKLSPRTRQKDIPSLWKGLSEAWEGSQAFDDLVSDLIQAGQGVNASGFVGLGKR
jgi:DNA-binding transcriptional ArsR family regulator